MKYWIFKQIGGLRNQSEGQREFYALLSKIAYEPKKNRKGFPSNFVQDNSLSNDDVLVAVNKSTKEIIIAFAGTRLNRLKSALKDGIADVGIALGIDRLGVRTNKGVKLVKKTMKKYGNSYDYTVTGHSLGGRLAQNVGKRLGIPAVTFSRGSSPLGAVSDKVAQILGRDKEGSKTISYRTKGDLIAVSSAIGNDNTKIVQDKKKNISAHSLSQYGVGKRKPNRWLLHVQAVKNKNVGTSYKEILQLASSSYVR